MKEQTYSIVKSLTYLNQASIGHIVDEKRRRAFDNGETIAVTKKEIDAIKEKGWCNLVKKEKENGG